MTLQPSLAAELEGALTPDEAAEYLDVRPNTLKHWRMRNVGPAYIKKGWKTILYPRKRLEQYAESRIVLVIPERVA